MPRQRITSSLVAEPPARTWSQCVRAGHFVFIAGQVGRRGGYGGRLVGRGDALRQSRQAFGNIRHLIEAAGGTMDDVVWLTVWLADIRDRPALLEARAEAFRDPFPAVTLVGGVDLASPELLVEIDAIAVLDHDPAVATGRRGAVRARPAKRPRRA